MKHISLSDFKIGNDLPFTLIAGPCQLESKDHAFDIAGFLKEICQELDINYIFKSSFDKANRSSISSTRGIGIDKSLPIFQELNSKLGCPILTDVHSEDQCMVLGEVVDILQIPAFLCRQTDLLKAAAETGKIVNVKKGQFLAPWDMKNIVKKLEAFGNNNIMLTERGASFGYNSLVSDMRSLVIMAENNYPIIFDATHSVQQPGGLGGASGGQREFVAYLARAAVATGVAGLFMETHQDPDNAPSDGPCMVKLQDMKELLTLLKEYDMLNPIKGKEYSTRNNSFENIVHEHNI